MADFSHKSLSQPKTVIKIVFTVIKIAEIAFYSHPISVIKIAFTAQDRPKTAPRQAQNSPKTSPRQPQARTKNLPPSDSQDLPGNPLGLPRTPRDSQGIPRTLWEKGVLPGPPRDFQGLPGTPWMTLELPGTPS